MKSEKLLRFGYAIGLIPLLVGSCIFFAWYFTRAEFLILTGLIAIIAFTIICSLGLFFIINLFFQSSLLRGKATVVAILILLNIPVAYGYVYWAEMVLKRVYVSINNQSSNKLTAVQIEGVNLSMQISEIKPNKTKRTYFYPTTETGYKVNLTRENTQLEKHLGYVVAGDIYNITVIDDSLEVKLTYQ